MSNKPVKRRLGRFAIAAVVYVAGVVAFSGWSYITHRQVLLANIDRTLANGAHAIREILCEDRAGCIARISKEESEPHTVLCRQLNRYAQNSGFTIVGAAARNEFGASHLIAGTEDATTSKQEKIEITSNLPNHIGELALDLAAASQEHGMTLLSTDHSQYANLRIAVIYKGNADGSALATFAAMQVAPTQGQLLELAIRSAISGLFLLLMAVPLVLLYNQAQHRASQELAGLNALLKDDVEGRKEYEQELKDAISDLERFSSVTTGRETRIIELKGEVNHLLQQMERQPRYNVDKTN